jgi:hypothetical protein
MTTSWKAYEYEVDMFKGTLALCSGGDVTASCSRYVANAIVESLLLHTRIVIDMLLSRGIDPDNDAVRLTTLLPGFVPSRLGELKDLYGSRDIVESPCWTLNKRLAHSTNVRSDSFDYTRMVNDLRPVIQQCLDEIDDERRKRGLGQMKRPEATSPGPSLLQSWNMSTSSG